MTHPSGRRSAFLDASFALARISWQRMVQAIRGYPRPRYTLSELIGQCELSAPATEESQAWIDAEPLGHEIH